MEELKSKPLSKIALLISSMRGGGVERVMLNLARGLKAKGVDVEIVVISSAGSLSDQVPIGVPIVDLKASRTLMALPALIHYLRTAAPATLLTAQTHNNVLAIWARKITGLPIRLIISEHSHMSSVAQNTYGGRDRFRPLVARLFYSKADLVVAVSKGVAEDLARILGSRKVEIRVIHNPIVPLELDTLVAQKINHPWLEPGEPPVVLMVGRLAVPKDYLTVVKALAILHGKRRARLLILGEGEQRSSIEAQIHSSGLGEDVSMPGFVNNPFPYLARASVFVLSSAWEGLPTVVVEALACGTSVVATNCPGGTAEILENGRYGRLVPVGDAEAMAEAIDDTIKYPVSANLLRARAADFSLETITEQYLAVLLGNE